MVDDILDLSRPDPAAPVATATPMPVLPESPPSSSEPPPQSTRYVDALRRRVSRWGGPAQVGFLAELDGLRPTSKLWPLLADADAAGVAPEDLSYRLLDALPAEAHSSWVGLLIARLPAVLAEAKAAPANLSGRVASAPVVAAVAQPTQAWAPDGVPVQLGEVAADPTAWREARWSTDAHLTMELGVLATIDRLAEPGRPAVKQTTADKVLTMYRDARGGAKGALTEEQAKLFVQAVRSEARLTACVAPAGAGKSYVAAAIAEAYRQEHGSAATVHTVALASAAGDALSHDLLGKQADLSGSIDRLLFQLTPRKLATARRPSWPPWTSGRWSSSTRPAWPGRRSWRSQVPGVFLALTPQSLALQGLTLVLQSRCSSGLDLARHVETQRQIFNTRRPHEALDWRFPHDAYLTAIPNFPDPEPEPDS